MKNLRETIIIPDEKQINIPIYSRKLDEYENHGLVVEEFLNKYNISLSCEKIGLNENDYLYIETAKLGHLVIQNDEDITIYLPPIITEQQCQFLLERKNEYSKYKRNIHAYSLYCDNGDVYINNMDSLMLECGKDCIDVLYQEIKNKYIPNKDSFILIIPDEEQLVIENGMYFQEFDTNIGHARMFQVFCMRYMLPIRKPEITGNPWAKELANNGFLVVKREKEEIYIFIPRALSSNQINWLNENREFLSTFDELEAGIYFEDGSFKEIFKAESYPIYKTNLELIEEIYNDISDKQENEKRLVRCIKS